eukprot:20218_1
MQSIDLLNMNSFGSEYFIHPTTYTNDNASNNSVRRIFGPALSHNFNNNPSNNSLIKAWKLMTICCSIFPPSDQFVNYLASYLYIKTKEIGIIGKYAKYCLHCLDTTMEIGQRRIQPIHNEIQTIIQMEPIPIKIYFLDGTFKNVLITSQTRTEQIMNTLSEILKSNHCKSFGLFEME